METVRFGDLLVQFDEHVLRPRPWTSAQSLWGAELATDLPAGPCLELCAGVGHIGLLLAVLVPRGLVQVDADGIACRYARANAAAAGLAQHVEVRHGDMAAVIAPEERFALILADPPWVPSADTYRFPDDPVFAIDGGPDGLDVARTCIEAIGRHLAAGGASILQLRDEHQVRGIRTYLDTRPALGLAIREVRTDAHQAGVLVKLTSART